MRWPLTISQWGLILDFAGVLLLFKYGLPSKILSENGPMIAAGAHGEQLLRIQKKNRKVRTGAKLGLLLISLGFVLQFFGSGHK
jgi:hypothetical protein